MSKKLKTLDEYNEQARENHQQAENWMINNSPKLNGIACPKCGEELYDSQPMSILASYPPQKRVHCNKCNYISYRIAW